MKGKSPDSAEVQRTQRDISFKIIAIGSVLTLLIIYAFSSLG